MSFILLNDMLVTSFRFHCKLSFLIDQNLSAVLCLLTRMIEERLERLFVCFIFLLLSRREEAMVMANLRKRVAAVDLTRKRDELNANDTGQTDQQLDNRPLLPKVS